jgi:hypothetical protein
MTGCRTQTDAIDAVERVLRCAKGPAARAMSALCFDGVVCAGVPCWPTAATRLAAKVQTAGLEGLGSEPWCALDGVSCIGPASVKGFASRALLLSASSMQHQREGTLGA